MRAVLVDFERAKDWTDLIRNLQHLRRIIRQFNMKVLEEHGIKIVIPSLSLSCLISTGRTLQAASLEAARTMPQPDAATRSAPGNARDVRTHLSDDRFGTPRPRLMGILGGPIPSLRLRLHEGEAGDARCLREVLRPLRTVPLAMPLGSSVGTLRRHRGMALRYCWKTVAFAIFFSRKILNSGRAWSPSCPPSAP